MNLFNSIFRKKNTVDFGKVCILVPTMYDSRYVIELCIKSIKKNTDYPNYEIIVCGNELDKETQVFLSTLAQKNEIRLIKGTDLERPKDDLVKAVDSKYYVILHDDIQIIKKNWLTKRLKLINKNGKNAIVGAIVINFGNKKSLRFFPMGILVKTDISKKLELKWGKQNGLDTGKLAYDKFFSQKEFKFIPYKVCKDIRHFGEMGWTKRKMLQEGNSDFLNQKLKEREKKIQYIKNILEKGAY